MKALVATTATQGTRHTDEDQCVNGELVWMIDPCPLGQLDVEGPCRCGLLFTGLNSLEKTTTATVRELAGFTRRDFERALRHSFDEAGWCACCLAHPIPEIVTGLLNIARTLPVGTVVERRLGEVRVRPKHPAG